MSDTPTPRTNKHLEGLRQNPELSGCNRTLAFARELERELAEEKYQHHLTRGCADLAIKHRDFAESELAEQVLCNGKGAEREADLLGKVERLERDNARLREALKFYADQQSYGLNGGSSQRIYSDAGKRAREALALATG